MPPKKIVKEKLLQKNDNKRSVMIIGILVAIIGIVSHQVYQHLIQSDQVNVPFDNGNNPLEIKYNPMKWGSFRPGVYFGMKTLTPGSLVTGMMWFRNKIIRNSLPIRHWCSQHDGLKTYGWKKHNFHDFGVQDVIDGNVAIKTAFVIKGTNSWSAKVDFKSINESIKGDPLSLIYYVGTENNQEWQSEDGQFRNDTIRVSKRQFPYPIQEPFFIRGNSYSTGDFEVMIDASEHSENVLFKGFLGTVADPPLVYLKETLLQSMVIVPGQEKKDNLFVVKGTIEQNSNWIAHQIVFKPPFSLFIEYSGDTIAKTTKELSSEFDTSIQSKVKSFDIKFEDKFKLKSKGYKNEDIDVAQLIASNLIGSVGLFHGYSKVSSGGQEQEQPLLYGPLSLLSGSPSRSFFPRGFLWDEGFHGLISSVLDSDLSVQILKSWLNLMNAEGWIPREVILGPEAEARVPAEFIVQRNTNANPPTLLLTLESLVDRNKVSKDDLIEIFPRLQAWYNWYNTSQSGNWPGTYRWRGRDANSRHELNPKTLTSGLDDYPRASHPTIDEYHIDLRCWMTLASRVMSKVALLIEDTSYEEYRKSYEFLRDKNTLEQLHWSDQYKIFCDKGLHSLQVKLVKPKNQPDLPSIRVELSPPEFGCVPEIGYVSLFPFLLQILDPSSDKLEHALNDIADEGRLWTPFGIRSLSKFSRYYRKHNTDHDPPYWRGSIWIQMNYLALKSLNYYSLKSGPYQERAGILYSNLRENVVSNILKEYKRTGYVWEHYDDANGKGKGSHPFTGFTALVVLIMAEDYAN